MPEFLSALAEPVPLNGMNVVVPVVVVRLPLATYVPGTSMRITVPAATPPAGATHFMKVSPTSLTELVPLNDVELLLGSSLSVK